MAKLTISCSDELLKRCKDAKADLNFSGVCQDALERALDLLEARKNAGSAIERLRAEKDVHDEQYRDMGIKGGLKDAERLSYEELLEVVSEPLYKTELYDNWLKDEIDDLEQEQGDAFNRDVYLDGWVEGVQQFYDSIKDDLK